MAKKSKGEADAALAAELNKALSSEVKREEDKHRIGGEDSDDDEDDQDDSFESGSSKSPCCAAMASLPSAAAARYRRHVLVHAVPSSPSDLSPPALWYRAAAVAIITFWLVALTAEAMLAESKAYLVATETSSSLFACLGAVTLITAAAVVYFTFQPSKNSLSCLFLSSLLSMIVLLVLVYLAEYSLNIVVDLIWLYQEGVQMVQDGNGDENSTILTRLVAYDLALEEQSTKTDTITFPPTRWVALETTRALGAFFSAMAAKMLLFECLNVRYQLLFQLPKESPLDVDTDDEMEEQSDFRRRKEFSAILLPWALVLLGSSFVAYVSTAYVDSLAFAGPDLSRAISATRLFLSLSTFFLFVSVLELRHSSTQAKEAKVVLAAFIVFIAAITHLVITNRIQLETGNLEEELVQSETNAAEKKNQRCFQECPVLTGADKAEEDCWKICIYNNLVCNDVIDMRSDLNLTSENATAFYSLESPPRLLLYPDELYCSSRLYGGIIFNYILAALVLVLSVSLGTRAAAIIAYFLRRRSRGKRRRSKRRRKGTDMADNYGAISDP